jgi:hypothetical protein
MKKDVQDYRLNGSKLAHWSPLLEKWLNLIKYYCRYMEDDVPYCYSERTNIGVLAVTAWKVGWVALEEFGSRKRAQKHGRSDLYIYPDNRVMGEYIEAKQAWNINKAEDALSQALKDAQKLRKIEGNLYIGLAFISPAIKEKYESEIDNRIQQILDVALKINCDAIAWSFPFNARSLMFEEQNGRFIYPGVLLLAKVAR